MLITQKGKVQKPTYMTIFKSSEYHVSRSATLTTPKPFIGSALD